MRNKLALFFIVALATANSVAAAETLTPYVNPSLVDGHGKFMGHILGYDNRNFTLLFKLSSGENIVLYLKKGAGGQVWFTGPLYYSTNDCTGPAFLLPGSVDSVDRASAVGPGNVLYLATGGPILAFFNSRYSDGGCIPLLTSSTAAFATSPVVPLDTLFQPPFQITDAAVANAPAINTWSLLLLAITLAGTGLFLTRFSSRV